MLAKAGAHDPRRLSKRNVGHGGRPCSRRPFAETAIIPLYRGWPSRFAVWRMASVSDLSNLFPEYDAIRRSAPLSSLLTSVFGVRVDEMDGSLFRPSVRSLVFRLRALPRLDAEVGYDRHKDRAAASLGEAAASAPRSDVTQTSERL